MSVRLLSDSLVLAAAALSVAAPVPAQTGECPVAGTKMHWIADYCMSRLETDDEIPASPCIAAEAAKVFESDCAAKTYYKKAMCRAAISLQQRQDDIEDCLSDPAFMGSTVRNKGVGGG